jgi:hypothetical protein
VIVKVVDFIHLGFGFLGTYWGSKSRFEVGRTKEKRTCLLQVLFPFKTAKLLFIPNHNFLLINKVIYVEMIKSIIENALNKSVGAWRLVCGLI